MLQGLVLVEGQTEEAFVERTLNPHLWSFGLHLAPRILVTRRVPNGPDFKGGVSSWDRTMRDLRLLTANPAAAVITTMIDFYGLPHDVPGMGDRPRDPYAAVAHVEAAIDAAIGDIRMHSFLQLHEFEALLFAEPDVCGGYLGNDRLADAMTRARADCGGPELVNDSPQTAPSKRILAAHPSYRKTSDGPTLVDEIGLPAIRRQCPHFDEWVTRLEDAGQG